MLVASGTSDVNGEFSGVVSYHFDSNVADSVGYNDHTLKAISGTDSSVVTYTVEYDDKLDTLTLDAASSTTVQVSGKVPITGKVTIGEP